MQMEAALFAGVTHLKDSAWCTQATAVANLTTGFGIERGAFEHHHGAGTSGDLGHRLALLKQTSHAHGFGRALIAGERLCGAQRAQGLARNGMRGIDVGEMAGRTRLFALRVHGRFIGRHINRETTLASNVRCEVDREAVGIVELEGHVTRNGGAAQIRNGGLKNFETLVEGLCKALFFLLEDFDDAPGTLMQLRKGAAHFAIQRRHQLVEKCVAETQFVPVAQRAPHDPAEHKAAAFIAGHHTVHHQKGAGPDEVGDHAQRGGVATIFGRQIADGIDEVAEEVDVGQREQHQARPDEEPEQHAALQGRHHQHRQRDATEQAAQLLPELHLVAARFNDEI
jgi:hypothetical protein